MATSGEEKILTIKVETSEALKEIIKYRDLVDELKESEKQLKEQFKNNEIGIQQYKEEMEKSRIKTKQYTESIRVLTKEVNNNIKKDREKIGSIKGMRAELSNLTAEFDSLSKTERETAKGQELIKKINNVTKELKEAEYATQRYYRNVGNYASAFDGLGMSIQQVARELPSLSMGFNTFFLAISNNLPILIDEVTRARKEYAALVKEGKAATPVWKQMIGAIFSWQTAMVAAITVLSMYGKEIINWVSNLVSGKDALIDMEEVMKDFNKNVGDSSGGMVASVKKLSNEWKKLGGNFDEQKKFIEQNKSEFDKLGISIKSVSDAENAFVLNKDTLVASIIARAKATATMDIAAEKYKQAITKMLEAEKMPDKKKTMVNVGNPYQANWVSGEYDNQDKIDALKEVEELNKLASELVVKASQLTDEEISLLAGSGIQKAEKAVKQAKKKAEKTYKDLKEVLRKLQAAIEEDAIKQQEEYNKRLAKMKADGAAEGSWEQHAANLEVLRLQRDSELKEFGSTEEMRLAIKKKYDKLMYEETVRHYNASKEESDKYKDAEIQIMMERVNASQQITDSLVGLINEIGESSKAAAAISKVVTLAQIAIDTGAAISAAIAKSAANTGGFFGFLTQVGPYIATIMANMANAIKTVKSAKFSTGGDVSGDGTSTSDSIPAMLSDGESVMTAKATSMFAPILSAFNQAGGGVPIYGQQAGSKAQGEDMLSKSFAKGLANMPAPQVAVTEIQAVQNRVKVIENINRI